MNTWIAVEFTEDERRLHRWRARQWGYVHQPKVPDLVEVWHRPPWWRRLLRRLGLV